MNARAVILSSVLLLALPLFAREKTDVIVMSNGDRFTGEIKGLDSGVLYVFDYIYGNWDNQPPGQRLWNQFGDRLEVW